MAQKLLYLIVVLLICSELALGFKKGEKGLSKKKLEEKNKGIKRTEELKVDVVYRPEKCPKRSRLGDTLTAHYTGKLKETGTVFDSSQGRGPISFVLGAGQVIIGWDRGLQGMCEGEKRKLIVPPSYAYGEVGYPPAIPPSATLVFDVELVSIGASQAPPVQEEEIPVEF